MIVGIHKARYGKYPKYLERYEEILAHNGIQHLRLDASDEKFWEDVRDLDLFIYRWLHYHDDHQMGKTILPIVEKELGVKCFPSMVTCWHYDDKIRQYYLLNQHGFPIIKSWIFWSKDAAIQWIDDVAEFPVIFKLKGGAGSSNVVKIEDTRSAKKLVRIMFGKGVKSGRLPVTHSTRWKDFDIYKEVHRWGGNILRTYRGEDRYPYWQIDKNYALFQEFMPGNEFDTRVTVIGDRAFAFRRINRADDFRSSGSGVISYDPEKIDQRFIETAFKISNEMGFQSMAYDFLYGHDRAVSFCEISYDYVDTAVFSCPGHWDSAHNWTKGNYWPQYCHLADTLGIPDLRQPEMDCPTPTNLRIV